MKRPRLPDNWRRALRRGLAWLRLKVAEPWRLPLGILIAVLAALFWWLPGLGLWMVPVGIALAALGVRPIRRRLNRGRPPARVIGPVTRGHMVTVPEREEAMLETVARIAPQVDRLHLVLNGFDAIPEVLGAYGNVSPFIPKHDLGLGGLFLPRPGEVDRVLLLSDDFAYPTDYVRTLLAHGARLGLDRNVVGYDGTALSKDGPRRYAPEARLGYARGVGLLSLETVLLSGCHLPPVGQVEDAAGFASWLSGADLLPWAVPREAGWLPPRPALIEKPLTAFPHQGQRWQDWRDAA
ncbi:hypothetical protein [Jannaschia aquimarina]|uniref:Uncharacterized protein n=1 Tax=Jannaschia aquimarina TaxID=935700 RepID=A0A0D1EPR7_9RHOB|nr:hypothetical protein [Jannaschia aquimarina]KIT17640.1 hypothetical protein jaqu_05310 [Jannaschia aquimarina]SNS80202.1 hypothetical protein SAMN05421775_102350 [Jannaschia aquimarina]